MKRIITLLLALSAPLAIVNAQDSTVHVAATRTKPAWFASHDVSKIVLASAGVGLISIADTRIAQASQRPDLHNNPLLQHSADFIQVAGDPGALVTSISFFIIGSATHRPGLADAGLHSTEAVALSGAMTQLLKLSIGRARPNISHDSNAYSFHIGHGRQTDYNSFPSGHVTAAFAAASVFGAELGRLHSHGHAAAVPTLYGVAALVGASRIYNNRHWTSDVLAGALIGHFVGERVTSHAHGAY